MKKLVLLLLICSAQFANSQHVKINEIMASNQITIHDDDGDTPDWIELYNSDSVAVDLSGYGLSDDSLDTQKWRFGKASIEPGQHLIVFASDKDRPTVLTHWETIVRQGDNWKYKIGDASIPTNWKDPSFDASSWVEGPSGFGYGDNDDATDLSGQSPFVSLFIRTTFTISDLAAILTGVLHVDYDDGFVAYLNGTEIAREGIGRVGEQPAWNATASGHEAVMYAGIEPEMFNIDNIVELLVEGENTIAIEVHNTSTSSSDLSIIPFISLGMTEVPDGALGTPEILGLSASTAYYHTNFKISADGESILFSDATGSIIDQVDVPASEADVSYGRVTDASPTWIFQLPTPGSTNKGEMILGVADSVVVSIPGGFYDSPVTVELSAGDSRIFYTLDGSDPDSSDTEYAAPLEIQQNVVLKAIAYKANHLPGPVSYSSYFINEHTDLPVISLSTDPYNLFHPNFGIYTNFTMDWERPAHVEFFEDDKSPGFSENCGIEIYGSQSANWDQKSISVKFKNQYGVSKIEYPLFPDFDLTTFKAFVLRNSGNDWQYTHIRDAVMQALVRDLDIDYVEYRPATTYINGEYWGIYNIREKINEHYIANRHGVDPDNIDMLENNMDVIHGDASSYQYLIDYINMNDMKSEATNAYLDSVIDLDECILYFAAQAYYDNMDWPGTNIKFWRERSKFGKWRWILFGLEFGFGLYAHGPWEDHVAFMFSTFETRYSNPPWATLLQRKLVQNPIIRNRFINQVADLLNTNFKSERVISVINRLANHISNEITRHRSRWGLGGETTQKLITFAEQRPAYLRTHMRDYFECGADGTLTINATTGGNVQLNTLCFESDELPWSGHYFQGNEVHLKAIPAPGYKFDGWKGAVNSGDPSISLFVERAKNLTASFSVDSSYVGTIVINEINYNSAGNFNSGDWIELYNSSDQPINLGGWYFSDSDTSHKFVLPDETIIESGAHLVLVENENDFSSRYPYVNNYIGEMGFGLNADGEFIKLVDADEQVIDSLTYEDNLPWPVEADGLGSTLELTYPASDNSKAENWHASKDHGTPGKQNSFLTSIEEREIIQIPLAYSLSQNYPNPFNPVTEINYSVPEAGYISLKVYDLLGKEIAVLFEGNQSAGNYSVMFNGAEIPSGVYIYQLRAGGYMITKKLTVIK